jgi:N-acetyl-anhydromuramyl-L-alanine amidase AmpD
MVITEYGNFKPTGKQKKKHQIILTHTSRIVSEYLQTLKYRYNGDFKRVPNYIITREGEILKLLENHEHTNYFGEPNINRNSVIITLENLGWLEKEPLTDYYVNWIGDIYKGNVYEKKWRDHYFWQPYTEKQLKSTVELCKEVCKMMSIPVSIIGHNTKINGVHRYEGVVTRSNFSIENTDLSPAFNFEEFLKKIEYEKQT